MKLITKEEIEANLKKLPEDLKEAFFSEEVAENILSIGKKFNLTVDKMGEMYSETNGVMLGLTAPKDYMKNLAARLGTDPIKTREIAEEINQRVFQPVRASLKKLHGLASSDEERRELKPEIIRPTGNRISIKTEKEEMEKIDVSEEIPGMNLVRDKSLEATAALPSTGWISNGVKMQVVPPIFAKKIEPKLGISSVPDSVTETKVAPLSPTPLKTAPSPLTFSPKPKLKSIDEMLDNISAGLIGAKESEAKPLTPPIPPLPRGGQGGVVGDVKSEIEKVLGGEIRSGTSDPYREAI